MTDAPPMHCPRCGYEPAEIRNVGGPTGWNEEVPPSDRWLDYIAHILEHLLTEPT